MHNTGISAKERKTVNKISLIPGIEGTCSVCSTGNLSRILSVDSRLIAGLWMRFPWLGMRLPIPSSLGYNALVVADANFNLS
jgi:hypothetical protein